MRDGGTASARKGKTTDSDGQRMTPDEMSAHLSGHGTLTRTLAENRYWHLSGDAFFTRQELLGILCEAFGAGREAERKLIRYHESHREETG
jgi:hypothetical protein